MDSLLQLFLTFAKIGSFTFGGGYAMLALIESICVEKKHWITHDELMEITVIAESTPGPIAINLATYVGYKKRKLPGAIVSTLGIILPSFIIIFLISKFLDHFLEITWVASAFKGIKLAVAVLIIDAAVKMILKMKKDAFGITILVITALLMLTVDMLSLKVSSLLVMVAAALLGLFAYILFGRRAKERPAK
ncbi:MAG: chromate transporter [Saccharofermentans sp.]|nr:chromate transporter [Saccharofermentans sp.]